MEIGRRSAIASPHDEESCTRRNCRVENMWLQEVGMFTQLFMQVEQSSMCMADERFLNPMNYIVDNSESESDNPDIQTFLGELERRCTEFLLNF